jgi:hypothetical protein
VIDIAGAERPLTRATLLWQLVVLVVVELLLYITYSAHDARFHYATHLLVGIGVAALWQSLFLAVSGRPARFQLLAPLGFHLLAMWPDLVFRAGVPHYWWMAYAALGHVSSHYMPGGDLAWLIVGLLFAGGYALQLSLWLHRRAVVA